MTVLESSPHDVDIDRLREVFGFEEVVVDRVLTGGMFARPVLLRTNRGSFVQRVHTFRNTEQTFCFQAETIESAWSQGVSCSRVEPTLEGKWCISFRQPRVVLALHRFVEGKCDDWSTWYRRKEEGSRFLHSLGQRIAHLHNALATSRPRGDATLNIELPPIQFRHLHQAHAAWREAIDRVQRQANMPCEKSRQVLLAQKDRIEAHWERLKLATIEHQLDSIPRQIVHGDISPVNIVFEPASQMTLIDWDCVHFGHRMYDALGDILNRPPEDRPDLNQFNEREVNSFVEGYASRLARPLEDRERQLVPAFCLARQIEDLRQRLRSLPSLDASQDDLYARLINMRLDMMDQIRTS